MEHWTEIVSIIIAFIAGLAAALWRAFTIVSRLDVITTRVEKLENDLKDSDLERKRLEDRLLLKLDTIESKLDQFIILRNGSK